MRSLGTAATTLCVWCVLAGCTGLTGCNYVNPGFKVKGNAEGGASSETGGDGTTGETGVSSAPVTTTTTEEPPTSTSTLGTAESSSGPVLTDTGDTEEPGTTTTGGPTPHECDDAVTMKLPVALDTFLVDRSWKDAGACSLIQEVAPEYDWPVNDVSYCRDRNFGAVPGLPLVDRPNMDGRDAIHYLVKFKVEALLDMNTQEPVEFSQIVSADLILTVKRLGDPTTVGAFALAPDQSWLEGDKAGEEAEQAEATYRCRVAPQPKDPVNPCAGKWTYTVPIPEGGNPMREVTTEGLAKGVDSPLPIGFNWTDFEGGLEMFFTPAGHQGFFVSLPTFEAESTGDRLKVLAREAAEEDPVLKVTYCPKK